MNATRLPPSAPVRSWSDLTADDLSTEIEAMGAARYRAKQLYAAIHEHGVSEWPAITDLPRILRDELNQRRPLRSLTLAVDLTSALDKTNKILFRTSDGNHLESVLMRSGPVANSRHTVCVSSQIGCPAACTFCASGLGGLVRNLSATEIADQVEFFAGRLRSAGHRVDNVVYMGMGEPFLNYAAVMSSINRLRSTEGLRLGARRFTVSTVGIVPVMERFAQEAGDVNLAVSLHAPNDEMRTKLVPYNQNFPIRDILNAVRMYTEATSRRVSFEYVLLEGSNDAPRLAEGLARLLLPLRPLVHVNLIPWNPFPEAGFSPTSRRAAESFANQVRGGGINTTVRYSKGLDISAACGQLRNVSRLDRIAS